MRKGQLTIFSGIKGPYLCGSLLSKQGLTWAILGNEIRKKRGRLRTGGGEC